MNFRYPIYLDLTGKRCVVTGDGPEVVAKLVALTEAAADVIYIHPTAVPEIAELVQLGKAAWHRRDFQPDDLQACFLIISCTPRNAEIFQLAESRGVLCNAVDDPNNCRFSHGSIHRQGDLTIGISTNGTAPALAVRLKEMLQREVGSEYRKLLELMVQVRPEINAQLKTFGDRKNLWYRIVDSEALSLFRAGDDEGASQLVREMIAQAISST